VRLVAFDPSDAGTVAGWSRTRQETLNWCSRDESAVPPEVVSGWAEQPDVTAYGLVDGDVLVAYGELWVDDEEAEVELARLIVDPARRNRGVGRRLVGLLTAAARAVHPVVFLRIRPGNEAALRCYAGCGFVRVSAADEAEWNRAQPTPYLWMVHEPGPT
jgi:[ribosomal protein S18]-alanine N-acetyltransferase